MSMFSDDKQVREFVNQLNKFENNDQIIATSPPTIEATVHDLTIRMMKEVLKETDKYENLSPYVIENGLGLEAFETSPQQGGKNDHDILFNHFLFFSLILRESILRRGMHRAGSVSDEMLRFVGNFDNFKNVETRIIVDLHYQYLPMIIANERYTESDNLLAETKNKIDAFNSDFSEKEEKVCRLKDDLEKYKREYNFVRLSQAFTTMYIEKKKNLKNVAILLCLFGLLMLVPVLTKIFFPDKFLIEPTSSNALNIIFGLIPFAVFEIFILYYFRIVLKNYYSLNAEILQLNLRKSLCAFIEGYADFSETIRSKNEKALEKFETLIFSNIIPDPDDIPHTLDGLDSIAKLICAIKNMK